MTQTNSTINSVSIQGLAQSYGAIQVLKELNLDIPDGEFLVLLGPSGCGKSTLLNCIAGLLEPTQGKIFIKGKNVTWEEPKDRGIGMVFQSYALYPQMTVERNLSFGLRVSGMAKEEIEKRVKRASEILQIEPLLARGDAALYCAKNNGRNQTRCYETLVAEKKLEPVTQAKGDIELF